MSKVYIIADPHINHINLAVNYRGFASIEEHDELIISNWNKIVTKRDKVFVLGDLAMKRTAIETFGKLNGSKVLIGGNHDEPKHFEEILKYFDKVQGCLKYDNCILTHIPIHESCIERFDFNIHGHIHGGLIKTTVYNNELGKSEVINDPRYINVSCEHINYTPILFEELLNKRRNEK